MKTFDKDPAAVLEYGWPWAVWLNGDTIDVFSFDVPTGLTEVISYEEDGLITLWLSGGTLGKSYRVTCTITTAAGRIEQRSAIFNMVDK